MNPDQQAQGVVPQQLHDATQPSETHDQQHLDDSSQMQTSLSSLSPTVNEPMMIDQSNEDLDRKPMIADLTRQNSESLYSPQTSQTSLDTETSKQHSFLQQQQQHDRQDNQQQSQLDQTSTNQQEQGQQQQTQPESAQTQPSESTTSTASFMSSNARPTGAGPKMTKSNILEAIKDFDSTIPDAVVHHFLNQAGMQTSDQRIIRLIAVAAQKFIHDIVSDSLQHCKLRGSQGKKTKEKKFTLAIEDLSAALEEYGIEVKRQQYFN